MTTWQRRLRLLLGVFVVVFAVVVFLAIGRRSEAPIEVQSAREDPSATSEARSGSLLQARGARPDFRLFYDKLLTYPDGRSRIVNVRVEVERGEGEDLLITSEEGEVAPGQSDYRLRGKVHLVSEDRLDIRTEEATYSEGEGILRAPGHVRFSKGRISGTSVGMTYDERRDVLWLLDSAVVEVAPEGSEPPTRIRAGAAGWARGDHYMRFERGMSAIRGARNLDSDTATAYLTEQGERLESLEMRGNSRVTGPAGGGAAGSLEDMRARDMNLVYGGSDSLRQATLAGQASIAMSGESRKLPGRRLSADWIDLGLADDGVTVNSLSAHNGVELRLPGDPVQPHRTIRGSSVTGSGPPGQGLNNVRFEGGEGIVEYVEARDDKGGNRRAEADRLELRVQPGLGAVDEALFRGRTHFADGGIEAWAREGHYSVSKGTVSLEGDVGGQPPRVRDERASIEAPSIMIGLDQRSIQARGGVKSVLLAEKAIDTGAPSGPAPGRRPSIIASDRPANATADTLDYDSGAGFAVYRGNARLWQLDTAIQADEISVDDRKGDLSAKGNVRTTMAIEEEARAKPPKQKAEGQRGVASKLNAPPEPAGQAGRAGAAGKMSVATAGALLYEEEQRRMTYTVNAHVVGPQGDVTADKIELYLTREGGDLERAEGYGHVTTRLEGRTATGDRLRYFSAEERYLMTGTPVRIVEECRETQGRTLTFFKSTDRIVVDGNEESRTQTKGGAKCGEPRFD